MSKTSRRNFKADFKAKVALEALKEVDTIETISKKYDVHPQQVMAWKKAFKEKAPSVFEAGSKSESSDQTALIQSLYAQIGELTVANNWLKKKLEL